jgi:kumamolisin
MSVFVAAGDDGCTDGMNDGLAHVDFPASSWFVTACGGTRLVADAAGATISDESVWNDGASGGGTGGGVSALFKPASYQVGVAIPPSVNSGAGLGRGVPDVAGNADPMTGYKTRVDGQNFVIGGTSAVAPLWAGLFALINESMGKPVGFINTLLYSSAVKGVPGATGSGSLRDIVEGNNDTTGSFGGRYMAGSFWNACTGLGTPDGTKLLNAIASA